MRTPIIGDVVQSIAGGPLLTTPILVPVNRLPKGDCRSGALPSATPFPGLIINTKLLQQRTDWFMLTKKKGSPAAASPPEL